MGDGAIRGLRLGELQALRWEDVDLERGLLRVRHSWDRHEGLVAPKSKAGIRSVPIASLLREHLVGHRGLSSVTTYVFGRRDDLPFSASGLVDRAYRTWKRNGLVRTGLHECRHTFASLMVAAGVNIKALQTFMGHTSITVTIDLYGHMLPGSEDEAAALLDCYLLSASTNGLRGEARGEQVTLLSRFPAVLGGKGPLRPTTHDTSRDARRQSRIHGSKRRGRDSNPRYGVTRTTVFETA